jgi:hypothetical protein
LQRLIAVNRHVGGKPEQSQLSKDDDAVGFIVFGDQDQPALQA